MSFSLRTAVLLTATALTVGGVAACSSDSSTTTGDGGRADCITDFDANTDYFPDKQTVDYAENFDIEYHNSYQVVTVRQPGQADESYVLTRCGAPKPELTGDLAGAQQIATPVTDLFAESTTHLPSLEALGKLDALTGFASADYVYSETARAHIADDDVTQFATAGQVDAEAVVAQGPQAFVTGGFEDPAFPVIERAGIPVLDNYDWLETDPRGHAEWIKFFAALTGTEKQATETFDGIVTDYDKYTTLAANQTPVSIVPGLPYQGAWSVPLASYSNELYATARITHPWMTDPGTGSLQTDLETVFARAGDAPVAISNSSNRTKAEAIAAEPRLAEFAAFRDGQVWTSSKRITDAGAIDIYEQGVLRPDLVLADLIAIAHPDLMPGHEFTFYSRLQ
ncbi:ABC transporter substrate-binding protein [Rhodococcus sp. TAF43]|uniref:ABC transporter substrate-binding protein n=1 Tax=unclassified Rhodococcus (in: high G+C Gram-positive bacteria) TaxID=192944 RepID=UPI001581E129|nr:ABC transporter substrate-binding protein [Rhodococcus sp. W8901]QKT10518.1 ABC transporter substrate-binding protein [Rhodococcus sp. W8901]